MSVASSPRMIYLVRREKKTCHHVAAVVSVHYAPCVHTIHEHCVFIFIREREQFPCLPACLILSPILFLQIPLIWVSREIAGYSTYVQLMRALGTNCRGLCIKRASFFVQMRFISACEDGMGCLFLPFLSSSLGRKLPCSSISSWPGFLPLSVTNAARQPVCLDTPTPESETRTRVYIARPWIRMRRRQLQFLERIRVTQ